MGSRSVGTFTVPFALSAARVAGGVSKRGSRFRAAFVLRYTPLRGALRTSGYSRYRKPPHARLTPSCITTALTAAALLLIALAFSGCGFRPLYGDHTGSGGETLAQIGVEQIPDRAGQKLRNMLLERLTPTGPPGNPAYVLSVSLDEARQELAIRKDETATRANLTVTAQFVLRALREPQLGTYAGVANSTNSYNVLRSEFATLSAENDARDRALRVLAEEIRIRIAAALQNPQAFFRPPPPDLG